jgi:DNA-binding response OmpR family regulator
MTVLRRVLVVEDDADTANLLQTYLSAHGYEVHVIAFGREAVAHARAQVPDLVVLDINLPEIDGFQVCSLLRNSPRTAYVPVIFLTERSAQSDRITGLSLGAVDYVTKPFDLEELRLRIQAAINRADRDHLLDPRTGLPTGRLVDEQVRRGQELASWHVLECRLESFRPFVDVNGFAAGDEVLKFAATLLRQVVDQNGTPEDFIGHPANDTFVILTAAPDAAMLATHLRARFNDEVQAHYAFTDVEQGYVVVRGDGGQETQAPLMTLTVKEK